MTERRVPIEDLLAQREWIRRLARGVVQGAADREDVEQETWVRALRAPPHPGGSLTGWLARVVRSVGIDRHRAETQRRLREQGVARHEAVGAGDALAEAEAFRRVVEAAYGLEEPHRTVVLLRYFEELPFAEIGRRLGIDEEAVRSRHRRALARMRERLDDRSGGDRGAWLGAVGIVATRRTNPAVPALVAAGVAGGVVMGAAKVTAAVVIVLAAGAWWALRDEGGTTPEPESATAASSEAEAATTPVRRARARTAAESRTDPAAVAPVPADPAAAGPAESADAVGNREVRCRVLDERGTPVAGATVRIVRANRALLLGVGAEVTTVTDETGSFTAKAPEGALVARVSLEGFADAHSVLVEGESELRVRLVRAWTLRGTVVAKETGQGAGPVPVIALRSGTNEIVVMTATDAEGKFAAFGLPEEAIDLRVAESAGSGLPFTLGAEEALPYAPGRLNAIPPRSGEVRIELLPGRSIAGVLVDDAGSAVSSRVVVELIGTTAQGGPDYSVRRSVDVHDPDGAFRIDGLAEGTYDLSFVPAGPTSAAEKTLGAVRVPAVATGTSDLRVVLSAGAPLRFRVVDPDGKPLDGGNLYVHPQEQLAGSHGTVMAGPRLDGRYETPPLDRSKSFDVLVTHFAGHFPAKRQGLRPGGDEVVVTLERAGRVTGRVLDEEGRPVGAGVPVTANGQGVDRQLPGSGWVGYTDATGSFVVEALGDHAFTFSAGGAESGFVAAAAVRDARTGRTDLVLRVRRGVALSGRLVDSAGKPVRTHLLNAHPVEPGGGLSASTKIDGDDGRFVFRGVPQGRVRVSCYLGDRFVDVGEVEAPGTDVELVLPAR